jgi:hypothetical protein
MQWAKRIRQLRSESQAMRRFLGRAAPPLSATGHMHKLEQVHSSLRASVLACVTTWARHMGAWKSVWRDRHSVRAAVRTWGRRIIGVPALRTWNVLAVATR